MLCREIIAAYCQNYVKLKSTLRPKTKFTLQETTLIIATDFLRGQELS